MRIFPRVLVTLMCGVLTPSGLVRADEADRAARLLEAKGAKLERDRKTRDKPVIRANLGRLAITDEDLALVAQFEWLEELDLYDTPITDVGLAHLHGLKRLKQLDLMRTWTFAGLTALRQNNPTLKIDHPLLALAATANNRAAEERAALALLTRCAADFGWDDKDTTLPVVRIGLRNSRVTADVLAALPHLPALRSLDLSLSPLGQADLAPLARMARLEDLNLYSTGVDDRSLGVVKSLSRLRILNVAYNPITDRGLTALQELKQLETLILFHTKVTDEGLPVLLGLRKLRDLSLSDTEVTDTGLDVLRGMTGLRTLRVAGTKVSANGVKKLVAAVPGLDVRR